MISCIAIDDEPLALKQIAHYIDKTPFLVLMDQFESALQAISFLQDNTYAVATYLPLECILTVLLTPF